MYKPDAVIFDMDGLVLDSEAVYVSAWQTAAQRMGIALTDDFCLSLSGLSSEPVQQALLAHCGADFDQAYFNELSAKAWFEHVQTQGIPVKKGVFALLKTIKDQQIPYCLATNSRRQIAELCLEFAGLSQVFPYIFSRDDVLQAKPAPDIFNLAANTLQVAVEHCLVLEDSPPGVTAALAAGASCIYIPSVYPVDARLASEVWAVVENLEQVIGYLTPSKF